MHLWPHKCYILFWTPTFIVPLPARQGCVITLYYIPLIELFCLFWFADLSCQLQCRSAAEPGSFYLVPGSHHQIFCYITLKNTPNLFDSFYSVFLKLFFHIQDDCLPIQQPISTFFYKRGKKIIIMQNLFEQFIYHFAVLTFDLIFCYQALEL